MSFFGLIGVIGFALLAIICAIIGCMLHIFHEN